MGISFLLIKFTQLIPKHGRNQNYCTVCEEDYEDYLTVNQILYSILKSSITKEMLMVTNGQLICDKCNAGSEN